MWKIIRSCLTVFPGNRFLVLTGMLLLGLLPVAIGCGDDESDVTDPPPVGQTVGPAGGTLTSADDNAQLEVPAGALAADTEIRLETVEVTDPPPGLIPDRVYGLSLGVAEFAQEVTLEISYTPDDIPAGVEEDDMLMYRYVDGSWVAVPGCVVDTEAHELSGGFGGSNLQAGWMAKNQDWCIDRFGIGKIIPSVPLPGTTTGYLVTSALTENDCAAIPTYPLQTQYVTISADGGTVTFMGIDGTWGVASGSGTKTQDIPVDIQNDCWCHQSIHFAIFFSDRNHFTGTYRVTSDYTSTCSAEDCTYQFDLTGVHQE